MYEEEKAHILEHYGVKGMKWGVRRTRRIQGHLDRAKKVRDGNATALDRARVAGYSGAYTSKGAARQLERGKKNQAAVLANTGKGKAINIISLYGGIRIKDLNYD